MKPRIRMKAWREPDEDGQRIIRMLIRERALEIALEIAVAQPADHRSGSNNPIFN